jgi:hypothetical protein
MSYLKHRKWYLQRQVEALTLNYIVHILYITIITQQNLQKHVKVVCITSIRKYYTYTMATFFYQVKLCGTWWISSFEYMGDIKIAPTFSCPKCSGYGRNQQLSFGVSQLSYKIMAVCKPKNSIIINI